jgi:PIN domain nuclease of toxin-antitoxin system
MSEFVTDTHALLWHLSDDPDLSAAARDTFRLADTGQAEIFIPSLVLVEIVYLIERRRVPPEAIDRIIHLPELPGSHYHPAPLDTQVVEAMRRVPREAVPDMPDRIIAATALALGLPLITRDARITASGVVACVW